LPEPFEFGALTSLMSIYTLLWIDCGASLYKVCWQDSITVPDDTIHDFTPRSLHLEFVHPHIPYSTNLAPFDIHLFGPLQDALQGSCFMYNDELKYSRHEELLLQCAVLRNWHIASCIKVEKMCW
jgi:hypothetical protein